MMRRLFSYIYLIFSFFILLVIFKNRTNLEVISSLFVGAFLFFIIRKVKNFKINNKLVYLLIIIGILIRVGLIFLNYGEVYSDYASFFNGAIEFSKNGTISKYVQVFPHLISYIATLGGLFRLFRVSYKLVIVVNIIFDLLASFIIMKMFNSKKAMFIWLLNPINIIWCGICHPVVITNSLLIVSIYIFYNLIKWFNNNDNKKVYIVAGVFGLMLFFANLFRPVMIIFVIALFIYFCFNMKKDNIKKTMVVLCLILSFYFGGNSLYKTVILNFVDNNIATSTFGWSMYVGANMDSNGSWNQTQQYELDAMLESQYTPTEIQEHFFDKAIDLYKSNGIINNLKFFVIKSMVLVGGPDWLSAAVFNLMMANPFSDNVYAMIKLVTFVSYFILLFFNLVIAFDSLKSKKWDFTCLLQLFIIGMVTSHMFVEVAERYSMPLFVPYTLLVLVNWDRILGVLRKKRK